MLKIQLNNPRWLSDLVYNLFKRFDKFLVKSGYWNRHYICRFFEFRNVVIKVEYLTGIGARRK